MPRLIFRSISCQKCLQLMLCFLWNLNRERSHDTVLWQRFFRRVGAQTQASSENFVSAASSGAHRLAPIAQHGTGLRAVFVGFWCQKHPKFKMIRISTVFLLHKFTNNIDKIKRPKYKDEKRQNQNDGLRNEMQTALVALLFFGPSTVPRGIFGFVQPADSNGFQKCLRKQRENDLF